MTELARCNGTLLVAEGDTVGVVERGGGWIGTAIFVAVLVAVFTGIGGAAALTASLAAGAVVLAIAVASSVLAFALIKKKRRNATGALPSPWLVFDRAAGVVRNERGETVGPLAGLRIERVFQAGSSSKALAVFCPNRVVVARGNPFGDDVDGFEAALRRALNT